MSDVFVVTGDGLVVAINDDEGFVGQVADKVGVDSLVHRAGSVEWHQQFQLNGKEMGKGWYVTVRCQTFGPFETRGGAIEAERRIVLASMENETEYYEWFDKLKECLCRSK